jgi:hypothetical protein
MKHLFYPVLSIFLFLLTMQAKAESSIPVLHSFAIHQDSIVFELTSYGCSTDADFELRVENGPAITLIRKRPDYCKRVPMVFQVKRSLSESGLSLQTPFTIHNPFAPPPVKYREKGKTFSK